MKKTARFYSIAYNYYNCPLILRVILFPFIYIFVFLGQKKLLISKGEVLSSSIEKSIEKFNSSKFVKYDIIRSIILFAATPNEYFLYGFNGKTIRERDSFLTDMYRRLLLKDKENHLCWEILYNKYNFYTRTENFFKRDAILFSSETSFQTFELFCKTHKRIFIKENCGSYGFNARLVDYSNDNIETIYNQLKATNTDYIIEVAIRQNSKMALWNNSSVNTVRIPTFLTSKGFFISEPFLRTGRAGAIVDNAGAGGIFAVIDPTTGTIITDGVDEAGNKYTHHPNSGLQYKGWEIPEWEKLTKLCEEAHRLMSDHIYIAYDFAYTDENEWVLIEGNWGQFISQIATQKGSKSSFQKLINND